MKYRMIGPERGGRVTTVTGVPSQPYTFYMGSTGGGVWKTTDAGHTWVNVSDGFIPVASMGAIEVSLSEPRRRLRRHRVVEDPQQRLDRPRHLQVHRRGQDLELHRPARRRPDRHRPRASRPIRTSSTSPRSAIRSCPTRSAAFTNHRRRQDLEAGALRFRYLRRGRSGAPARQSAGDVRLACGTDSASRGPSSAARSEGGIYKSTDGGETWTKLAGGLPNDLFGRSNVAISAAHAQSHLRADRGQAGLRPLPLRGRGRHLDAGQRRRQRSSRGRSTTRRSASIPNNADVVFIGDEGWFKSMDGGKTFRRRRAPHGDHHDIWINPEELRVHDPVATTAAPTSRSMAAAPGARRCNQPTAEIYQVAVDNQYPYRVYGAQQDNTTVIVPSLPTGQRARISASDPAAKPAPSFPTSDNPEIVYGSCKGQFSRLNLNTTERAALLDRRASRFTATAAAT